MAKKPEAESTAVIKARDEFGKCVAIVVNGREFVFKPLELEEFEDFQQRAKTAPTGALNRECCMAALVSPALSELQEAFRAAPGFAAVASQAIMQMAFDGIEVKVKKD